MHPQDTTVRLPLYCGRGCTLRPSGRYTLIDAADLPLVGAYHWRLIAHGRYVGRGVAPGRRRQTIYLARVILGLPHPYDGRDADHINHDRFDNRRANLRIATHAENGQNHRAHRNSRSGHRGVYWHPLSHRWRALIRRDYRTIWSGQFRACEAAIAAVVAKRRELLPYTVEEEAGA